MTLLLSVVRPNQSRGVGVSQAHRAVGPVIDTVYPLDDVVKAHEHLENGHTRGKVVLRIGS